jgi:ABC-2 type transport system permease protein
MSGGGYRLRNVIWMEWIRLRSLRSTFWLAAAVTVGTIGIGSATLAAYRSHLPRPGAAQMVNDGLAGLVLGQLLIGVLGVLTMTGEYSSGMIRATLAAVPNRRLLLTGKAIVLGAIGVAVGELAAFGAFLGSQAALSGSAVPRSTLGDPAVLRTVVLGGVYLALIGLIGLGIGAAVRHAGAAIGTLFGLLLVPMFVLVLLGPVGLHIATFMPMFLMINSIAVVKPTTGCPSAWTGIAVICGYAVLVLGLGGRLLARRDA